MGYRRLWSSNERANYQLIDIANIYCATPGCTRCPRAARTGAGQGVRPVAGDLRRLGASCKRDQIAVSRI
jgi:hypothetical protein